MSARSRTRPWFRAVRELEPEPRLVAVAVPWAAKLKELGPVPRFTDKPVVSVILDADNQVLFIADVELK